MRKYFFQENYWEFFLKKGPNTNGMNTGSVTNSGNIPILPNQSNLQKPTGLNNNNIQGQNNNQLGRKF